LKQKHSRDDFLELLEPLRDQLYRYARRATWQLDDATDAVQEAVLTAWKSFAKYQPGTNFRAWIFQILVYTVYRFNKQSIRHRSTALDDIGEDFQAVMEQEESWSLLLDHPDQLKQMLDERLVTALDELGHDERQCLLLRLLEDFSYKEIAGMMNIPLGTTMSHVYRARKKLRQTLAVLGMEQGRAKEKA